MNTHTVNTTNTTQTAQRPFGSAFGASSTADDVIAGIDLAGKTAIVTGGYAGIGLEIVRVLRAAGARVIVPARDLVKASAALARFDGVAIEPMDLMNPASIDAFAKKYNAAAGPLHILINNAGIMACPLMRDARGHEAQFSTNHLGHFQLTARLWPALRRAGGARVVAVSSRGHRYSPVVFEDIDFLKREYQPWLGYGQSKSANILFALELDRRGAPDGIRAFSAHPGSIVNTDLSRHLAKGALAAMGVVDGGGNPILDPLRQMKTVAQGAATIVWCATNPALAGKGGVYCENNDIAPLCTDQSPLDPVSGADANGNFGVMPHAIDPAAAARLWDVSGQMLG
ncbi:SDR family NAD(P)-dependent oxidoreductase [Termitidicoccus mucosus]|uniref:Oxidoreductase n=1 Tax=Termitidicoccus mucosus TaxID=1184151 RepID=A0A178IHB0_9BACT|nr:oxidoreductase [Opitutaceae bacterium TSB47]